MAEQTTGSLDPVQRMQSNPHFAYFLRRMQRYETDYVIPVPAASSVHGRRGLEKDMDLAREAGITVENDCILISSVFDDSPNAPRKDVAKKQLWLRCVARQFIDNRVKIQGSFLLTRRALVFWIPFFLLALFALSRLWPVWDFLFDVESDANLKTLGVAADASNADIKKAYRALVKMWHPDLNPACGIRCRDKMMEIQKAHDALMASDEQKRKGSQNRQQYEELLAQVVSFMLYRGFDMATHSLYFLAFWIERLFSARASRKAAKLLRLDIDVVKIAPYIRVGGLSAFCLFTFYFVTGLQPVLILMCFVRIISIFKQPAGFEFAAVRTNMNRSNFDSGRTFCVVAIPAFVVHLTHYFLLEKYPRADLVLFEFVYGMAYLIGHIVRYAPNLFDNFAMQQCTVPRSYLEETATGARFTLMTFLKAEMSFLLDDLFAFATKVPAFYRVPVLLLHVAFLLQLRLLPRIVPRGWRKRSRPQRGAGASGAAATSTDQQGSTPGDGESSDDEDEPGVPTATDGSALPKPPVSPLAVEGDTVASPSSLPRDTATSGSTSAATATGAAPRPSVKRVTLTPAEVALVARLDQEALPWLVVPRIAHRYLMVQTEQRVEQLAKAARAGQIAPGKVPTVRLASDGMDPLSRAICAQDERVVVPGLFRAPDVVAEETRQFGSKGAPLYFARARAAHLQAVGLWIRGQVPAMAAALVGLAFALGLCVVGCAVSASGGSASDSLLAAPLPAVPSLPQDHPLAMTYGAVCVIGSGWGGHERPCAALFIPDTFEALRAVYGRRVAGASFGALAAGAAGKQQQQQSSRGGGRRTGASVNEQKKQRKQREK